MSFHRLELAPFLPPQEESKGSQSPRAQEEMSCLHLATVAQQSGPCFCLW